MEWKDQNYYFNVNLEKIDEGGKRRKSKLIKSRMLKRKHKEIFNEKNRMAFF